MTNGSPTFDRRAFLALIAAAGGVACTGGVPMPVLPSPSESATSAAGASEPPSAGRVKRQREPFEPLARDAYPNAKRLAGRFVVALTTYDAGEKPQAVLRRATKKHKDAGFDFGRVLRNAGPLFHAETGSRGTVVYPQLGGLTLDPGNERISVMVVVQQELRTGAAPQSITRTVDVRLRNRDDQWQLEDLADAGGKQLARPAKLPELARRVLDDTRIELPDSARWDIFRGDIDDRILDVMVDLAGVAPFAVAVLKSGHPYNVFGTDLISGHTQGRGVDIWRVAGKPVVLQQPNKKSEAHEFTESALKDFDVPELGSPWDLDGPPEPGKTKPSFTDAVHADHIHVAFKAA